MKPQSLYKKSSLINEEHRLVYMVKEDCIYILQCRFHY
ncbi:MAG: type II toxin-antitoxin system YoeB family toxin [Sediminibacterium sp.]|nr:type II toxin-antitoxin system YoeB family toxin [Sediminibacterium sp.]